METDNQREQVWWTEPSGAYVDQIDIKPYYADVDLDNNRLQDMAGMSRSLRSYLPYPTE